MISINIFKSTLIFALGNMISKLLIFFLLPLMTYYYSQKEFGEIDLFSILISLLMPIISLSLGDFILKETSILKNGERLKSIIFSNFIFTLVVSSSFLIFMSILSNINILYFYVGLATFFQIFSQFLKQIIRAKELNKIYVLSEILYSFVFALIVFGSIHFSLSYQFYYIATIFAYILEILYLTFKSNFKQYIIGSKLNKNLIKEGILYSFPLILNSLIWYIINISSRYFIIYFMGFYYAGIFAANLKIPFMINMLYSYLYKAVQVFIYKNKDEDIKFLLNVVFGVLFCAAYFLIVFNDSIIGFLINDKFQTNYFILPILYLSAIFASYASLLGINYEVTGKTKLSFYSSLLAGVSALAFNIILIPSYGLFGASISMVLSFAIMVIMRIFTIKKPFISLNNFKLILCTSIGMLITIFPIENVFIKIIELLIVYIIMIMIYYKDIITLREDLKK